MREKARACKTRLRTAIEIFPACRKPLILLAGSCMLINRDTARCPAQQGSRPVKISYFILAAPMALLLFFLLISEAPETATPSFTAGSPESAARAQVP
jgi:hypothetical protein